MRLAILSFAAGVAVVQQLPALPAMAPLLSAVLVGLLIRHLLRYRPRWRRVAACLLVLMVGVLWATWRAELRLADRLEPALEGRDVTLVGTVASLPARGEDSLRFDFEPESRSIAKEKLPRRMQLSWYGGRHEQPENELPNLLPGERWQLTVRLRRPRGNANPGGFDYEAWLLARDIGALGYVRPEGGVRLEGESRHPLHRIERWRAQIRARFDRILPREDNRWQGVIVALAIGDQRAIDDADWARFNRLAISHLVAISGLHITLVAGLIGAFLAAVWRRHPTAPLRCPAQTVAVIGAMLGGLFYALLAGFGIPAQRTVYMLMIAGSGLLLKRQIAASRVLTLALGVVVTLDPWAVLAPGFWLSFAAVAALFLVAGGTTARTSWREKLRGWVSVQWAATLATIPILLAVFQQFSLVSPFANALAIPVVSLLVTPLALLAAVLPWWPLAALAHFLFDMLMGLLNPLLDWPVWRSATPPLTVTLIAGMGVVVLLLPRGTGWRVLGALLLLPLLCWPSPLPEAGTAEITVLDVGQGLAVGVQTRHHLLVYDPGPRYGPTADAGGRVVLPWLNALGVSALDMLVVTHRDSDHAGGLASLRAALPIGEIRSSLPGLGRPCLAGQRWVWDGVEFSILHPSTATLPTKANHASCVLRIAAGNRVMLLTSDIEAEDEAGLLQRGAGELAADILLVPHHGSRTSSTASFLAAVNASEAVIPVGYRNRFGHPKEDVVARHLALGSRLWRTDRDGAVSIRLRRDGYDISAWRAGHWRYWFDDERKRHPSE